MGKQGPLNCKGEETQKLHRKTKPMHEGKKQGRRKPKSSRFLKEIKGGGRDSMTMEKTRSDKTASWFAKSKRSTKTNRKKREKRGETGKGCCKEAFTGARN